MMNRWLLGMAISFIFLPPLRAQNKGASGLPWLTLKQLQHLVKEHPHRIDSQSTTSNLILKGVGQPQQNLEIRIHVDTGFAYSEYFAYNFEFIGDKGRLQIFTEDTNSYARGEGERKSFFQFKIWDYLGNAEFAIRKWPDFITKIKESRFNYLLDVDEIKVTRPQPGSDASVQVKINSQQIIKEELIEFHHVKFEFGGVDMFFKYFLSYSQKNKLFMATPYELVIDDVTIVLSSCPEGSSSGFVRPDKMDLLFQPYIRVQRY